ncbi:efflux RND transporter periplasmic adaptor subunit [Fulvivirgaceae bacterium PWU5]|uniref:Efflux RND transporter periplasmic adaptor subunit n=1 Tax=Dawidia cretensis TaxID=2782350 RepID=A0AAP2DX40_9BACT|nr:efflux RND transporter periplasmic adaptor subunit [Dawidia cretensis]MBT1707778.1 efflux RND transporter periplasmic adaptor subunit [Dawidia cretensis]
MNKSYRHRLYAPLLGVVTFALLAAGIAACTTKAENLEQPAVVASAPVGVPVDVIVLQPHAIHEELEVTGTLVAYQEVDIVSELTRRIVQVNAREGSHVKKGTLLFRLDDADLQAQLERFRQQEKLAVLNEKRLKDLLEKEAISQQDYDEAITNLKVLQAQINEVLVMVDKTRIVAPFDGQLGMINTHPGAIVSVNTILTDIEDNSQIKVEFSIPEKYTNVIQLGSEQHFTLASDDKPYTARVFAKGASLSQDTRTLLVRALAKNTEGKLLAGQSARISLGLSTSEHALSVPSQALLPSTGGYTVYVSRRSQVVPVPVKIGQRSTGLVEIVEGLTAGDTVIVSNLLRLGPGAPVAFASIK